MIIKLVVLMGLYKLLLETCSPILSSAIYAVVALFFGVIGLGFIQGLIFAVLAFAVSFLYFWLLNEFQSGLIHYVVLILGLPLCLI